MLEHHTIQQTISINGQVAGARAMLEKAKSGDEFYPLETCLDDIELRLNQIERSAGRIQETMEARPQ